MECTMDATLRHAKNLALYLNKCDSTYIVHIALKELGLESGNEGFQYAKNSIRVLCTNPNTPLKNGVYLAASTLCAPYAADEPVEQAIRRAIQKAWKERDERIWECYFPTGKAGRTVCPSNREFLMAVVDFVELWKAFCEEVNYAK